MRISKALASLMFIISSLAHLIVSNKSTFQKVLKRLLAASRAQSKTANSQSRTLFDNRILASEICQTMVAVDANQYSQSSLRKPDTMKHTPVEHDHELCSLDQTWFQFTKLIGDTTADEDDLVSGTACLLPAFYGDPEHFCASISLSEKRHWYSSNNFSTRSTWVQSEEIPSPLMGFPAMGSIHLFHLNQDRNTSYKHEDSSISDSGMSSDSSASIKQTAHSSVSATKMLTGEAAPVQARIQMVAQLLGQQLTHRRNQADCARFFDDSVDLHAVLEIDGADENTRLILAQINPAWTRILGWSSEDLIGKSLHEILHTDDISSLKKFLETQNDDEYSTKSKSSSKDGPSKHDMPPNKYCFENRLRAEDGSYRWMCWSVAPKHQKYLGDMKQQHNRLLVTGRDVSSRKEVEMDLWQSRRRLRESQEIAHLGQWELDLVKNELYWSGKWTSEAC